jgi:hypothetical protein
LTILLSVVAELGEPDHTPALVGDQEAGEVEVAAVVAGNFEYLVSAAPGLTNTAREKLSRN